MSSNNKRTTNASVAPKPFCKVCQDAGKTEKEYTSHYVKSEPGPKGKVVCPTLLAQECRYCFGHGHTAGYCPVIATNKKVEEKALRNMAVKNTQTKPSTEKKKSANKFAGLEDSDEDEKVQPIKVTIVSKSKIQLKDEFPALPSSSKKVVPVTIQMTGYATVAAKKPEEYANAKYEQQLIATSIKRQMPPIKRNNQRPVADEEWNEVSDDDSWEEEQHHVAKPRPVLKASLLDWAATYDSDDEDW